MARLSGDCRAGNLRSAGQAESIPPSRPRAADNPATLAYDAARPATPLPPGRFLERADNLVILGKATDLVLAEDLAAVHNHIQNAATSPHQLGLHADRLFDLLRQTGGKRVVVSLPAIGDGDIHESLLPAAAWRRQAHAYDAGVRPRPRGPRDYSDGPNWIRFAPRGIAIGPPRPCLHHTPRRPCAITRHGNQAVCPDFKPIRSQMEPDGSRRRAPWPGSRPSSRSPAGKAFRSSDHPLQ